MDIRARKLELKEQFLQVRGIGREDRIERAILLKIRQRYEAQMNKKFDPILSKKLDCIQYLLEA